MKKDIEIPEVNGVYLVAAPEFNEELGEQVWNIFLLNGGEAVMDTVMVVLRGFSEDKKTSVMRKRLEKLEPGSYARLEFLREELLDFRNEYLITFFQDTKMMEKNFRLDPGQVSEAYLEPVKELDMQGIMFE